MNKLAALTVVLWVIIIGREVYAAVTCTVETRLEQYHDGSTSGARFVEECN